MSTETQDLDEAINTGAERLYLASSEAISLDEMKLEFRKALLAILPYLRPRDVPHIGADVLEETKTVLDDDCSQTWEDYRGVLIHEDEADPGMRLSDWLAYQADIYRSGECYDYTPPLT